MKKQKALILPIGEKDWNGGNCAKFDFMLNPEIQARLKAVGWTIGVDLKGGDISWAGELAKALKEIGGVLSWHPSLYPTLGWGSKEFTLSDMLKDWADQAKQAKENFGLEVLNIHLGAPQYAKPAPNGPDRFNCLMTAEQMIACINAHIPLLREMNKLCGNILTIENLHMYFFNDEANVDEYYTYNVMHVGAWYDLPRLAAVTGVSTCVDIEHWFGSNNFLNRYGEFKEVPSFSIETHKPEAFLYSDPQPEKVSSISLCTGYEMKESFAPRATFGTCYDRYTEVCKPLLIHLGTASEAIVNGLCGDHREFNLANPKEKEILQWQLKYIKKYKCLGGVIEACGWHEGGFEWTRENRAEDPDQAKFNAFLSALEVLEEMHN